MFEGEERFFEVLPFGGFGEPLTYKALSLLTGTVLPGCLVRIPLQRRTVTGVVLNEVPRPKFAKTKLKNLLGMVWEHPVLTPDLLKLASWLSQYYACSMESVVEAMIPAPVRRGMQIKKQRFIEASPDIAEADLEQIVNRAPQQSKLLLFPKFLSV